jgi:hypothetical protein
MMLKIGSFLNKQVLVSIPSLFDDGACRAYKLVGVELHGLWLQSDDLAQRLLSAEHRSFASASPVVFVPFAHIAGILIPTAVPADLTPSGAENAPASVSGLAKGKSGASSGKPSVSSAKRRGK